MGSNNHIITSSASDLSVVRGKIGDTQSSHSSCQSVKLQDSVTHQHANTGTHLDTAYTNIQSTISKRVQYMHT